MTRTLTVIFMVALLIAVPPMYAWYALATRPGSIPVTSEEDAVRSDAATSSATLYWLGEGSHVRGYPAKGDGWEIVFQNWGDIPVAVVTYIVPDAPADLANVGTRRSLLARVRRPDNEVVEVYAQGEAPAKNLEPRIRDAIQPIHSQKES